jgi:broad specificity phosphatase PhoE
MGTIYLVRHGQASFGSANYDQLSELGFEQVRLLGQWFANTRQGFHRVVMGGMQRHRQSADTCLAELPKALLHETEWRTDTDFAEFDHHQVLQRHCPEFGDAEAFKRLLAQSPQPQLAFRDLFEQAMLRWMSGQHADDYVESWPQFRQRCVDALGRVAAQADAAQRAAGADAPSQASIVFTSGGVIAALTQHLLGLPDQQVVTLNWSLANGAVTRLRHTPGQISLSSLNNYAHLEWLGEAGAITYI